MLPYDAATSAARLRNAVRSRALRRFAVTGLAALAPVLALSACGSDDNSDSASPSAKSADVHQILNYIGPVDAKSSGRGQTFDVGVTVALSGGGSVWGSVQLKGAQLAAKQIAQLGGPTFNIISGDNQSGAPAAGVKAAKKLVAAHSPMGLTSYVADVGSMLPDIAKHKMLSLDGGGGTSLFAQGAPYFWGSRAITPNDTLGGLIRYVKETSPDAKRVAMTFWDIGGALNKTVEDDARAQLEKAGMELVLYEPTQIGAADFNTTIEHIANAKPDVVFAGVYGIEVANFMKQYVAAGVEKPVYGFDITKQAQDAAGPALDHWRYTFDYFDAAHPPNGWAKIFAQSYRDAYGSDPDFYAANFYEDMFVLWDCVRRVIARGGDPQDGAQLQSALEADPVFKSVYGGSPSKAGTIAFDLKTHSVAQRPMGLFEYSASDRSSKTLAQYDIDGADYRTP
jgi:ABC-type branched-subunit amino acid transport system substrate-binding protein